jgi:calpain-15
VIQGSLGDCYFLSAVSALAEKEERIRAIFGEQGFNRNGIYKVTLRIGGIIQEIVVDENVPVNKNG